ncbi:hypothetical protein KCP75_05715 [Salmonella enterica subsp. enterica]|nr:hypothetical protein KCP75_05715 [Salmonella enterica subsp. enterica]
MRRRCHLPVADARDKMLDTADLLDTRLKAVASRWKMGSAMLSLLAEHKVGSKHYPNR